MTQFSCIISCVTQAAVVVAVVEVSLLASLAVLVPMAAIVTAFDTTVQTHLPDKLSTTHAERRTESCK